MKLPAAITQYWSFYWPLALMGAAMLLGAQFQNATLARYPNATVELATFAIAASIFAISKSFMAFTPQLANVFSRSDHGQRMCFRFVLALSVVITMPITLLAFTTTGNALVAAIFDLDEPTTATVARYLRIVSPAILLEGVRMYWTGLLIQSQRTRSVTVLNALYLSVTAVVLVAGVRLSLPAVVTVGSAQMIAAIAHASFSWRTVRRSYRLPDTVEHDTVGYAELVRFYWPLALNSVMFAFIRPTIYAFVSRTPDPQNTLAALRVSFELTMIFFNPLNQFRHLYVTFGREDPVGVKRFMIAIMLLVLGLMLILVLTPLGSFVFGTLLGVSAEVEALALQSTLILCAVPLAITLRNTLHGISLIKRSTGRMGFSGVIRNIVLTLLCWALYASGTLNAMTASAVMVSCYLIEATTEMIVNRFAKIR